MPTEPLRPPGSVAIRCQGVWKVFGRRSKRRLQRRLPQRNTARTKADEFVAVRDVSFSVLRGEIFVVMGLSGSGKSTLLRCISRLLEPTDGQIWVDGENVTAMNPAELRQLRRHKMSMVFQRFGLFAHRSVIDNVAYGLEIRGMSKEERRDRARGVIDLVGLSGWESRYPHELSGGMQQRVGLARALAVDPSILLCDEPFSALDPLIRREMQQELLRLQQKLNKTILFVTHDFLEAVKLGDRIAIMKDGAIVQVGTPEEIVTAPADEYVRAFTQEVPRTKVLTARSIMRPVAPESYKLDRRIAADTKLEKLIHLTADSDDAVAVVADDAVVGEVSRTDVMVALAAL